MAQPANFPKPGSFPLLPALTLGMGLLALVILTACGDARLVNESLSPSQNRCPPGGAVIGVGDGSLSRRCGCNEAAQQFTAPSSALTCTVAAGTTVFFDFGGTLNDHQIVSQGSPSIGASPLIRCGDDKAPRMHVVKLTAPGTYTFRDAFIPTLSGQIVVQ
jgi:hypothetical protein